MGIRIEASQTAKSLEIQFANAEKVVTGTSEKAFRKRLGLTQNAMAGLLHVSTHKVIGWEEEKQPLAGGDATLVYLLMEDPKLVHRLLKVTPKNGFRSSKRSKNRDSF